MIPLLRPLVCLDCETTGVADTDRIIQLAAVALMPDGSRVAKEWMFDPGEHIPEEATAIHGITDLDVAGCPSFKSRCGEVLAFLLPCDFAGYNVRFDLKMLNAELARAGQSAIPMEGRRVVDALSIYRRREPRDLAAAVRFYAPDAPHQPHDAMGDVLATLAVLEGQLAMYDDLPRDVAGLAEYCLDRKPGYLDDEGKITRRGLQLDHLCRNRRCVNPSHLEAVMRAAAMSV